MQPAPLDLTRCPGSLPAPTQRDRARPLPECVCASSGKRPPWRRWQLLACGRSLPLSDSLAEAPVGLPLSRLSALLPALLAGTRSCSWSTCLYQRPTVESGPCASPGLVWSCCFSHERTKLLGGAWSTSAHPSTEVSNNRALSGQLTSAKRRSRRSTLPELVFRTKKSSTRRRPTAYSGHSAAARPQACRVLHPVR